MNQQKIYISGKISGLSFWQAVEKFEAAEQHLTKQGYTNIVNPIKVDHSKNINKEWDEYMKADLKAMMDCNAIYMLPCWRESPGAKLEFQLAVVLNYSVIFAV